jgi:hypothetical protein
MTTLSPPEFSDQHYAALGKMLVAFQDLEQVINEAVVFSLYPKTLMPTSVFGFAVASELSFSTKVRLLRAYAVKDKLSDYFAPGDPDYNDRKAEHDEQALLLDEGLSRALEVEQDRNRLVHSNWNSRPALVPSGTVLRSKRKITKQGLEYAFEQVSVADLEAVAAKANRAWELIQGPSTVLHFLRCSHAEAS